MARPQIYPLSNKFPFRNKSTSHESRELSIKSKEDTMLRTSDSED